MEGIVLEVLEDKLIVLIKGGEFLEADKPDYDVKVGQKIIIDTQGKDTKHQLKRFISAAAIFMVLLTGGYGVYAYYVPYGYINVDINPSVEMSYNLYKKPISLQALNEDGNKVIKKMGKFQRTSIEYVIDKMIEAAAEEKFITKEKDNIILITITELTRKIDNKKLENKVKHSIQTRKIKANTIVIKSNKTTYQDAKKQGVSPGKLILDNQMAQKKEEKKSKNKPENKIKPKIKQKTIIDKQEKQKSKRDIKEQRDTKQKKIDKKNKKEKHK